MKNYEKDLKAAVVLMDFAEKQTPSVLRFDGFTLDLERRGLYRGEQRVRLTSKPLETLIFLTENRGRVVEKHELLDAIWKDTFVTEDTLVHAIREIRRALKDDKDNPRFVQTVPRQGYRFVCEVIAGDERPFGARMDHAEPSVSGAEPIRTRLRWLWLAATALIVISIVAWIFWPRVGNSGNKTAHREPHAGRVSKQITAGEFASSKPTFSADGKFILYVSSSEDTRGFGDLFIKQYPEGTPVRITKRINPSGDLPVFTADGSHVVFSIPRFDQAGLRHQDLWEVPSFGGPPQRLIEDASGAGFSPDSKWLAYTKHLPAGNALWLGPANTLEEHVEVNSTGYTPRWSPDGKWIAYSTSDPNGGHGDIWICKISQSSDGSPTVSDERQVTRDHKQVYGLTWAADSLSIIFASRRTGSSHLYQVSIADGSISSVLAGVGEYEAPSASPDGRTVIFYNKRLFNDLMLTTLGTNCEAKNITFNQFHLWPRISPSGEKLVSVLRQVDNAERLYLTDLRTKESSELAKQDARHPCWLDDENVAFLTPDVSSQSTEVLVVNTTTRETRRLTRFAGEANWLAIHPDKSRVAVVVKTSYERGKILLLNLSNSVNETIHEGLEYEYLRWSPDGSALCWNKPGVSRNAPEVSGGIWMVEMGQTEPRLLARDGYCPIWSEDGQAVYFTIRKGRQGLWQFDLRQKRERQVCAWGRAFGADIVGSRLVFAQHKNDIQIYSISMDQKYVSP